MINLFNCEEGGVSNNIFVSYKTASDMQETVVFLFIFPSQNTKSMQSGAFQGLKAAESCTVSKHALITWNPIW